MASTICRTRLEVVAIRGIGMVHVEYEVTKEVYEKNKDNPEALVPDWVQMGYGCYGARFVQCDGKYYMQYSRGDSCD